MKYVIMVAVIALSMPGFRSSAGGAQVGVYFDQQATINCLPEVTTFPYSTEAYIVATGGVSSGGVLGWEMGLRWDNSLIVSSGSIAGDGINFKAFPDYVVGLAEPVTESDIVVLAQVNVLALGPGGIIVRGLGISAPDSLPAILFEGETQPQSAPWKFGGIDSHAASIGIIPCPTIPTTQTNVVQEAGFVKQTMVVYVNPSPRLPSKAASGGPDISPDSNIAFRGTIVSTKKRCVEVSGSVVGVVGKATSVLEVVVDVTERYLGVVPERVNVFVVGYDLDGCTVYSQKWDLPPEESVVPGSECLVGATNVGGVIIVSMLDSFRLISSKQSMADLKNPLKEFSERKQMAAASVVVDGELVSIDNDECRFRVVRKLKGEIGEFAVVEFHGTTVSHVNAAGIGKLSRLYLSDFEGQLFPLFGRHSVQLIGSEE